jgi:hypothetical protein
MSKFLDNTVEKIPIIPIPFVACVRVGPDYVPPEPNTPEAFSRELSCGLSAETMDKAICAQGRSRSDWGRKRRLPNVPPLENGKVTCAGQSAMIEERLQAAQCARPAVTKSDAPTYEKSGPGKTGLFLGIVVHW